MCRRQRSAPRGHSGILLRCRTSAPPVGPGGDPEQTTLISWLRADPARIPEFSLVAVDDDEMIGLVLATRAHVDFSPELALGPVSVDPVGQRTSVGTSQMYAVLAAADARGERVVGLLVRRGS